MSADQSDEYHCPKCGEKVAVQYVSQLAAESRMSFSLAAEPGSFLSAKTVGGSIQEVANLLIACGRDLGAETEVAIEAMSTENGTFKIDLLLTRHKSELIDNRAESAEAKS